MPKPTMAPQHQYEHATTFVNSHSTPLYSQQWMPTSAGHYAATCIFLVVLAMAGRGLVAFKAVLEQRWKAALLSRQRDSLAAKSAEDGGIGRSGLDSKMGTVSTAHHVDESDTVGRRSSRDAPFRPMVDLCRALLFTVITGVTFLLLASPHLLTSSLGLPLGTS